MDTSFEMKGYEITQKLSHFGTVYKNILGVVSIDQIPKEIPVYNYLVCNLSLSKEPGMWYS